MFGKAEDIMTTKCNGRCTALTTSFLFLFYNFSLALGLQGKRETWSHIRQFIHVIPSWSKSIHA